MKTEAVINAMNWTGMALNLDGFYLNTRKSIWGYFMLRDLQLDEGGLT